MKGVAVAAAFLAALGSVAFAAVDPGATSPIPASAGSADCAPPDAQYRVLHPTATTVVAPARSPPAASLAGVPATSAATVRHVIPIGRLKPWRDRCPPPQNGG